MPHKKAKRSVKEQERKDRQTNIAPISVKLESEDIPKGAARILNAAAIQQKYREDMKKRAREGESEDQPQRKRQKLDKPLKIQPGESMGHFNRRVEDHLRSDVQAARTTARQTESQSQLKSKKQKAKPKEPSPERSTAPSPAPVRDFASASTTKRVRDVVLAPPSFTGDKFSARAKVKVGATTKAQGIVSPAQARMMELEREKAIARYRALKATKAGQMQV